MVSAELEKRTGVCACDCEAVRGCFGRRSSRCSQLDFSASPRSSSICDSGRISGSRIAFCFAQSYNHRHCRARGAFSIRLQPGLPIRPRHIIRRLLLFWVVPAQPSILSALASRALPKSLRESAIPLSNQEHSVLPCQSAHNMRHNLGAVARSRVIQLSLSGVLGTLPRNCQHTSAVTRKPNLLTAGPVGVPGTRTSQSAFSRYRYHRPRCQRSYCT